MPVLPSLVRAGATLTFTGQPVNLDTIHVGDEFTYAYEFKPTPATAGQVKIGATLADSIANLAACINGTGVGDGSDYIPANNHDADGVNPVAYVSSFTGTTLTVKSRLPGEHGNSLSVAESCATASWSNTFARTTGHMTGGVGSLVLALTDMRQRGQLNAEQLTAILNILSAS